jgi:hypothetical protein
MDLLVWAFLASCCTGGAMIFRRHWWHHTAASQNMVGITTSAFYTPAFTLQLYASRSQKKLALFLCHIEILIVESD